MNLAHQATLLGIPTDRRNPLGNEFRGAIDPVNGVFRGSERSQTPVFEYFKVFPAQSEGSG